MSVSGTCCSVVAGFVETSELESVSMSADVEKTESSSRFPEDKSSGYFGSLVEFILELNFDFKVLVVFIGPGIV